MRFFSARNGSPNGLVFTLNVFSDLMNFQILAEKMSSSEQNH